ncbi:sporulation-specific diadenylate cyclase CdaS [Paenibacillus amylolyticus]|uniref:sporulation-specific diadenylate cyclase CdaS n=1 Tax=Paenibacillus amylolyticus TaxID=1451 RepID=UPI003D9861FB
MMTQQADCNSSLMRQKLKADLHRVADRMNMTLSRFDNDSVCLLGQFAEIRAEIKQIEVLASSFYLDCYLSPFTEKFAELTSSVQHLSDRRYGALIVIEREVPLETIIHSGVAVDARVTHALLESLFIPGAPLHDGAVLIRGNQIVSAGNVLPLSQAEVHERKIGTRHRAALGLSEITDAVVLVVSEETGQASFAVDGDLHPINVVETLP